MSRRKKLKKVEEIKPDPKFLGPGVHSGEKAKVSDKPGKKLSIAEIESILNRENKFMDEEDSTIQILPNGEIRAADPSIRIKNKKPLTMRDNLGGEYGERAA